VQLFHFSDDGSIKTFHPRAVVTATRRARGYEWLNSPLVWAIDAVHQPMYYFPRDCPRILMWKTVETTPEDAEQYFGNSDARMIAFIEKKWQPALASQTLYRYEFPIAPFIELQDAGMWVSKKSVDPIIVESMGNLPNRLAEDAVELRIVDDFLPLRKAWQTSLHLSGIRLRNAANWEQ